LNNSLQINKDFLKQIDKITHLNSVE